jgi:hypothetical protein
MANKLPESITSRYKVKKEKTQWSLTCNLCGQHYYIRMGGEEHGPNILALLNHAMRHDAPTVT